MLEITTLIENTKGEHKALHSEHGLSFFIENDGFRMVFDTGQSDKFIENAYNLGIDLSRLDAVALSHGHYDHSGGFRSLANLASNFLLYTGKGFFCKKYGVSRQVREYLGNNFDKDFVSSKKHIQHFEVSESITQITKNIYAITKFPRIHADEVINQRFYVSTKNGIQKDLFEDEISIVIDTDKGLVVLLGCAHPGMKNMLSAITDRLDKRIYAVLGGTHLVEADENTLNLSIRYLKEKGIQIVGPSHCTGQVAMERLASEIETFNINRTGTSLHID